MAENLNTSWFNLSKYDQLKNFDLTKWYFQLSERHHLYKYLFEPDYRELLLEHMDAECWKDNISGKIKLIKENPMLINRFEPLITNSKKKSKYKEIHYPFNTYSVSNVTLGSLCFASSDLLPLALKNDLSTAEYSLWQEPTPEQQEQYNLSYSPCSLHLKNISDENSDYEKYPWITINLRATDEQILNDFKHWLAEYRKEIDYFLKPERPSNNAIKESKNFTTKKLDDWVKWRVLPYLDLKIIAKYEGKRITYDEIRELLFPDDCDEDKVKKNTKRKADWLMNEKTINAIYNQVLSL